MWQKVAKFKGDEYFRKALRQSVLPCLAIPTSISYIHYRSNVLEHLLIQGFFFILTIFHIVKQNYETHMESISNQQNQQKVLKKSKYILYLRFFK